MDVAAPEHVRGIDDDHRQPQPRQAQGLGLGRLHGADVGNALRAGARDLVLRGRRATRRRPDGGHRGGVDHALHSGAQRLLEDDSRALHVDTEQLLRRRMQADQAGTMKHALHSPQRTAHRPAVKNVAAHRLVGEVQVVQRSVRAHGEAQVIPSMGQPTRDVGPDEPPATGDQSRGHPGESRVQPGGR